MKKIIFLTFLISLFLLLSPEKTFAQSNKTWCVWIGDENTGSCVLRSDCDSGYFPYPINCGPISKKEICVSQLQNCVAPGTVSCVWTRGYQEITRGSCHRSISCGPGFEPSPKEDPCYATGISEGDCLGRNPGTCVPKPQTPVSGDLYNICLGNTECDNCVSAGNSWTAIGCIQTSDPQTFITWLLGAAIGMAGGIAVLLMIFGGLLIILSSGDPQRLQSGKDILTSAIIGLVIIIFSIFLLRIIGVEILKIPGFE